MPVWVGEASRKNHQHFLGCFGEDKDSKALEMLGDPEKVTAAASFEGVATLSCMESLRVWADPRGVEFEDGS